MGPISTLEKAEISLLFTFSITLFSFLLIFLILFRKILTTSLFKPTDNVKIL